MQPAEELAAKVTRLADAAQAGDEEAQWELASLWEIVAHRTNADELVMMSRCLAIGLEAVLKQVRAGRITNKTVSN